MSVPASLSPRPELLRLLAGAKAAPGESLPRLILADWLEEYGGEADRARAQFIRLQANQPAALPYDTDSKQRAVCNDLLRDHREAWLRGLPATLDKSLRFDFGLLRADVAIARLLPKRANKWACCESLAWLERLTIRGARNDLVAQIVSSPFVRQASCLSIPWGALGSGGTRDLVSANELDGLIGLDLNHNHIGDEGVAALANSERLANIQSLELWVNSIGVGGAKALATSPWLHRLRALNLGGNSNIGPTGLASLMDSPFASLLQTLLVWDTNLGLAGARAFVQAKMPALRRLYLNQNQLGREGGRLLSEWPGLRHLRFLSLWNNQLGPEAVVALAEAPMRDLEVLLLSSDELDDLAAIALARSPHLGNLRRLDLRSNKIGDIGARALLGSPNLRSLQRLDLSDNQLSPNIVAAVARKYPGEGNTG